MKITSKIKHVIHKKTAKTLLENFVSLSLLQVAGYAFPLLTYPYLARVIGVEGFGKIAFAAAVVLYFQTVVDWGFNFTATRDVARNRENQEAISYIFSTVMWARIYIMFAALLLFVFLLFVIPLFYENRVILFFTFLLIPGHLFFPEWLFQGLEKMKYITIFNVVAKLLFTLLVFVFIRDKSDYLLHPLLIAGGYTVVGICAMYMVLRKWHIKFERPNNSVIFQTIKNSADVFVNQIFPNLYNAFSVLLLGAYGGNVANGILDAGSKIVNACQQFFRVISRTFFPYFSRNLSRHGQYARGYLLLSLFVSIILFSFAPLLMKLFFTEEFYEGFWVLRIIAVSGFFLTLSDVYGTNFLIIIGKERLLRNITMVASILGFCLAFPLVYFYSFIGAALVIAITRCLLGGTVACYAIKLKRNGVVTKE